MHTIVFFQYSAVVVVVIEILYPNSHFVDFFVAYTTCIPVCF